MKDTRTVKVSKEAVASKVVRDYMWSVLVKPEEEEGPSSNGSETK